MKTAIRAVVVALIFANVVVIAGALDDGVSAAKQGDYATAARLFRSLAEQGNAGAQHNLGIMYERGNGVPQDYSQAVQWYRKAAAQGNSDSQYNLGVMYANGQGVQRDYSQAVQWYRKSAEAGHIESQYNLGLMYANGEGVPQDFSEAVKWYRKAAEHGYASAQSNLGLILATGQGVRQDEIEALQWFRKAAAQGDAKSQSNLAFMYETGKGTAQDHVQAVYWYRKAADQGVASARSYLDELARAGESVNSSGPEPQYGEGKSNQIVGSAPTPATVRTKAQVENEAASKPTASIGRTVVPLTLTRSQRDTVIAGVRESLKDPDSAKFGKGPYAYKEPNNHPDRINVCGFVNAKNSYGGYTGENVYFGELKGQAFEVWFVQPKGQPCPPSPTS